MGDLPPPCPSRDARAWARRIWRSTMPRSASSSRRSASRRAEAAGAGLAGGDRACRSRRGLEPRSPRTRSRPRSTSTSRTSCTTRATRRCGGCLTTIAVFPPLGPRRARRHAQSTKTRQSAYRRQVSPTRPRAESRFTRLLGRSCGRSSEFEETASRWFGLGVDLYLARGSYDDAFGLIQGVRSRRHARTADHRGVRDADRERADRDARGVRALRGRARGCAHSTSLI